MSIKRSQLAPLGAPILFCVALTLAGLYVSAIASQPAMHRNMPVGFTDEGYPYIGNANASVTLEEWSDYLCPYCGRHFQQTYVQLLEEYVRGGDIRLVFRDLPLAGLHPTAEQGHVAALCVGEQSVEAYWAMHDELFARQSEWSRLADPGEFLARIADELVDDMDAYRACTSDGRVSARVEESVAQGRALGFNGTPSFRFRTGNSEKSYSFSGAYPLTKFAGIADALIAGEEPPEEPEPEPAELPMWAKPEGLQPDPDRPGFNIAGDAFKGNPDAALVVVEFNDFQCPACQRHALEAQPSIDKELIDTGKVMWVDKHLPLKMHPYAPIAAVAAECAGDQQRYWQMHTLLHAKSGVWTNDGVETALVGLARELNLNVPKFRRCFDSRQALERVLADLYDAQGLILRAPTFVMIQDGRGSVTGPLPADQFVKLLSTRIENANTQEQVD